MLIPNLKVRVFAYGSTLFQEWSPTICTWNFFGSKCIVNFLECKHLLLSMSSDWNLYPAKEWATIYSRQKYKSLSFLINSKTICWTSKASLANIVSLKALSHLNKSAVIPLKQFSWRQVDNLKVPFSNCDNHFRASIFWWRVSFCQSSSVINYYRLLHYAVLYIHTCWELLLKMTSGEYWSDASK